MSSLLVAGVYLADRAHTAAHITFTFAASRLYGVTHRWVALASGPEDACEVPATVSVLPQPAPKFAALNGILHDAPEFDWCIITDDDIELPQGFADCFLAVAERHDFALCQPARTEESYVDHGIVVRSPGLSARRTRFVEIGPMVALRRDAMALLLPFAPDAGMGWGLDFIWPARLEAAGLRMGIVDATPITHRLRRPVTGYSHGGAARAMAWRLAGERHLTQDQAFRVIEAYV